MYFSYGKEMIRLEGDDSRHSSDLNLHIKTSGYEDGETLDLQGNLNGKDFNIKVAIYNNQAIVKNIFYNQI
ncbi:hypothetical protein DMC01_07910 [Campylobacter troglodytis]|nr:hypothetical protein DMC01_07910 [Campylobacter troglodytis]